VVLGKIDHVGFQAGVQGNGEKGFKSVTIVMT